MKKLYALLVMISFSATVFGQGCIPVRNLVGFGQFAQPEFESLDREPVKWLLNINTRYYEAWQSYNGSEKVYEDPHDRRINHMFVLNLSLARMLPRGWSYAVDVPVIAASRTTWQEHDSSPTSDSVRYTNHTFGVGDIRLTLYKWLWSVSVPHRGNVQLGLGVKLPTGDYRYQDYFHRPTGKTVAPVNQTIQPGDGGTGFTLEANAFYKINRFVDVYGNLFYLFNPRDQNGVSNTFGRVLNPSNPDDAKLIASGGNVNSVPDAYAIRAGANYTRKDLVFWCGFRMEGQPVHDLIGGSNGQRRAGKIISVEPGLNYKLNKVTLYMFVPLPVYRTTYQTVPDKELDRPSPGGFANYLIFVGTVFKL